MLTFTKAMAMLSRPHLITPDAAAQYLPRLLGFDPRVARHSQPLELVARLAQRPDAQRATAMDDDDDREPRQPPKPLAYAPRYIGEPDAVSECGWALKSGVGLMCIDTPLVDKGFGVCGVWFHGYDTIEAAIREMDADARVKAIFIKWDSPGGVVAPGLYDLTAYLQARGADAAAKPMWSYADVACSGAYWLSSQSARLICHEAAFVGSIGAVYTHTSFAGYLEKEGIAVTPIQFGAHKTDGADFKVLDDNARADLQAEIDQIGEDFLATVAAGRGARFTAEQARATEARVYTGRHTDKTRDALALGLVDAVMPEKDAFAALLAEVKPATIPAIAGATAAPAATSLAAASSTTETDMKRQARIDAVLAGKTSAKTSDEKLDEIKKILAEEDDEEDPKAEGEGDEPVEEDPAEEDKPDAAAALARAQAILALPEAKGREALAHDLAFDSVYAGVSVEKAKATLAKAPLASKLAGKVTDPKITADGGKKLTDEQQLEDAGFAAAGIRPRPRK